MKIKNSCQKLHPGPYKVWVGTLNTSNVCPKVVPWPIWSMAPAWRAVRLEKNRLPVGDHIWAQNTQAVLHHTATPPGGVVLSVR